MQSLNTYIENRLNEGATYSECDRILSQNGIPEELYVPWLQAEWSKRFGALKPLEVINPITRGSLTYTLPPAEAVVAAYEYSRGNFNTWEYPTPKDHPQYKLFEAATKHIHSCGNWMVILGWNEIPLPEDMEAIA